MLQHFLEKLIEVVETMTNLQFSDCLGIQPRYTLGIHWYTVSVYARYTPVYTEFLGIQPRYTQIPRSLIILIPKHVNNLTICRLETSINQYIDEVCEHHSGVSQNNNL